MGLREKEDLQIVNILILKAVNKLDHHQDEFFFPASCSQLLASS